MPKSIDEWNKLHDRDTVMKARIDAALKSLAKENGPAGWEYEAEFRTRAGLSTTDMGKFRDHYVKHLALAQPVGKAASKSARIAWFVDPKLALKANGGRRYGQDAS